MPQHSTATFTDHAAIKTVHFSVTDDPDDRVIATVELFATPASATYSKLGGSLRDLHVSRPLRPYECVGCVADEFVTQLVHKDPRRPARATVNGRAYALPGVGAEGVDPDTREGRAILELFQAVQALDTRGNIRPDLARRTAPVSSRQLRPHHRPPRPPPDRPPQDRPGRRTPTDRHAARHRAPHHHADRPRGHQNASPVRLRRTRRPCQRHHGTVRDTRRVPRSRRSADRIRSTRRPAPRAAATALDAWATTSLRNSPATTRRARLVRATVNGRARARVRAPDPRASTRTRARAAPSLELFQAAQALDTRDNTRPDIVDELHVWFARLGLTAETTTP
ncbi:hypothetical protein ACU686_26650 [Yinghuangia aomiensis]